MMLQLPYGKKSISVEIPYKVTQLHSTVNTPTFNIQQFRNDFKNKIPEDNIATWKIAIVVSDKSRKCEYSMLLPELIKQLIASGATKSNITFFIAYGTHSSQTNEESIATYGQIFTQFKFIHHNCSDINEFKKLGCTKSGTEILIRKDLLESNLVVTVGAISYHYFAGFGGGRKLIFPGLGESASVLNNHKLFLDKKTERTMQHCWPGNLQNNPIADDLREFAQYVPKHLEIHGILDAAGELIETVVGSSYADFLTACEKHMNYFQLNIPQKYDITIASAGGYPKDINFIQAHKALHHASLFTKKGGKIILFAECIDGIGSNTFFDNINKSFTEIYDSYSGNGGTAISLKEKTELFHIYIYTHLKISEIDNLGLQKLQEPRDLINELNENSTVCFLQNASMYIPKLGDN